MCEELPIGDIVVLLFVIALFFIGLFWGISKVVK